MKNCSSQNVIKDHSFITEISSTPALLTTVIIEKEGKRDKEKKIYKGNMIREGTEEIEDVREIMRERKRENGR